MKGYEVSTALFDGRMARREHRCETSFQLAHISHYVTGLVPLQQRRAYLSTHTQLLRDLREPEFLNIAEQEPVPHLESPLAQK